MKADLLAYGEVFVYASLAMLAGGFFALLLLRASGSGTELSAEHRAEAMAG
jgi:hypothetical protein